VPKKVPGTGALTVCAAVDGTMLDHSVVSPSSKPSVKMKLSVEATIEKACPTPGHVSQSPKLTRSAAADEYLRVGVLSQTRPT
jgi:hypothetical protein